MSLDGNQRTWLATDGYLSGRTNKTRQKIRAKVARFERGIGVRCHEIWNQRNGPLQRLLP